MDLVFRIIVIAAVVLIGIFVLRWLSFLFLLFIGRVVHPPRGSMLGKLVNWAAYYDRMNTHIMYKPRSQAKLVERQNKPTEARLDSSLERTPGVELAGSGMSWAYVTEQDWIHPGDPFRGSGPDNSEYVREIVRKLQSLGIEVSDHPTSLEIASTHRVQAWFLNPLLPDRILVFDREMISSSRDYGVLLNSFAQISGGDWKPRNVRAAVDSDGHRALIEFMSGGEEHSWDFEHHFDWVSVEFDENIKEFADSYLPGRYIHLRTDSQESAVLYLPKEAAEEFARFLDGQ